MKNIEKTATIKEIEKGEIIVYQPDEITRLEVRVRDETVWLNRQQLATLFGRDVKTIGKHINNALNEELAGMAVVANFATTATDGKTYIVEFYNLEMILSVGYRVKSQRGIYFRRWSNSVLKEFLLKRNTLDYKLTDIEQQLKEHHQILIEHEKKIDFFIQSSLPPKQGIFFDGQVYDAYAFVAELVRKAGRRIVLIDNYIDEVYLIGASIKDLGKKWFGFTLMENTDADDLLQRI